MRPFPAQGSGYPKKHTLGRLYKTMFDVRDTPENRKAIAEAGQTHRKMTEPFIVWEEKFFIFPRKCYLTGKSTGWFKKVMVGEETFQLKQLLDNRLTSPRKFVYAIPAAYTFAQLKDDERLKKIG